MKEKCLGFKLHAYLGKVKQNIASWGFTGPQGIGNRIRQPASDSTWLFDPGVLVLNRYCPIQVWKFLHWLTLENTVFFSLLVCHWTKCFVCTTVGGKPLNKRPEGSRWNRECWDDVIGKWHWYGTVGTVTIWLYESVCMNDIWVPLATTKCPQLSMFLESFAYEKSKIINHDHEIFENVFKTWCDDFTWAPGFHDNLIVYYR